MLCSSIDVKVSYDSCKDFRTDTQRAYNSDTFLVFRMNMTNETQTTATINMLVLAVAKSHL
jgi:hypothetical protein